MIGESNGISDLLRAARRRYGVPALVAAVVRADDEPEQAAVGVRRLGNASPVCISDRFHIGSNAKAMTADLVAGLVEEGRLVWSTRPAEVLGAGNNSIRPAYSEVTLERLLVHRAGLPAFTGYGLDDVRVALSLGRSGKASPVEMRRRFAFWLLHRKPAAPPGSRFVYSNAGYAVAAAMVEPVTGESYGSMLQTRLFQPLGIRVGYGWPAREDPWQPWGHWRGRSRRRLVPQDPNGRYKSESFLVPAGDVHLSVGDYARFLQLHLRGLHGRDGPLRADTVRQLHTPVGEYALGWGVWEQGGMKVSGHEGSAGTFHTVAVVVPTCDVAVVVFANSGDKIAGDACREVGTELLQRLGVPA